VNTCRVCLEPVSDKPAYHPRCLKELFGTGKVPAIGIDTGKLHTAALAMVGRTSLSGVQKKISLGLSVDRTTLTVLAEGSRYILKPQTGVYPSLPENEQLTTRLAELTGIETAPSGLLELTDGTLAFLTRRFDRLPDGRKLRQEDFCQLAQQAPKDKYSGSAERCVRIIQQYASEPLIELMKLYRLLLFSWWSGNGDMHLKNFSLLSGEDDITRLTPAYDLVSTHLVIPGDPLALPVGGKKANLVRSDWLGLADYCDLPRTIAERMLGEQADATGQAVIQVERSFLPPDQKDAYLALIRERTRQLRGAGVG